MSADRADEENLKATSFSKGEWGDEPIALEMDYGMVAETFGLRYRGCADGQDSATNPGGVGFRDRRARPCFGGQT